MQISTVHHDKPEDTKIPKMATKMLDIPENKNITASERRKRLLPYVNFYIDQNNNNNYNQPSNYPNYITQQSPEQIPLNNYNELTRPQVDANRQYYQDKNAYTPFLESNALSGSFSPMIRSRPQKVRLDYVKLSQRPKTPNFSAIYDKLSQLKLAEQSRPLAFNQNYRNPQHNVANLKPQVNYISIQDYRPQKYKTFPEAKPILRTYSPTIVDIQTTSDVDYVNENYRQIPVSIKQIGNVDPKKFVDQGKQEIAVELSRPNYIADQGQQPQYGQKIKQPLHQQLFIIQKPLVSPHKYYQDDEKHHYQGLPPIQQPSNYILPKPIHINKLYSYQGVNHNGNIEKYVPAPSYEPLQIQNPVESYEYYPQKISSTDRYEFTTAGRPTEAPILPTEAPILPTENTNTLSLILKKLQDSNALPHTFTPDNIDNSIRTLVKILNGLKKQQKLINPIVVADENGDYLNPEVENGADIEINDDPEPIVDTITQVFPDNTLDGGTPGKPGIDYPQLSTIPPTSFNCKTQRYKGFFGDPDTLCQVWHYCDLNGGQASFLCPNGTIFSQVALTCDWWYNVKCSSTTQLYVLNERLYKYILPLSPKFPEDYSGPLVDKYLALKFQEMEEKMERERKGKVDSDSKEATESEELENEEDGEDTNREKPET